MLVYQVLVDTIANVYLAIRARYVKLVSTVLLVIGFRLQVHIDKCLDSAGALLLLVCSNTIANAIAYHLIIVPSWR
jgi:putative cell wall-binding protein